MSTHDNDGGSDMASNVDLVNQAYEAFGRGDIPGLLDLLDEGIDWSSPGTLPQAGTFAGREGALAFFQGIGAAWENLGIEVEGVGDAGDGLVVAVVHGAGELRDGGKREYGAAHAFTVQGGKITRFREFTDLGAPL